MPQMRRLLAEAISPERARIASDSLITENRIAAENEVRERLADHSPADRTLFIDQALEGYAEQDRRSERSERRATTMLGSTSIITAILAATGGILASSNLLEHGAFRIGLALLLAASIGFFGLSARFSLPVLGAGDHWRRPATRRVLDHRAALEGKEFYVHVIAAILDSIKWNQKIADRKAFHFRMAARAFGYGLATLLVSGFAFLLLSAIFPAG